MTNENRGVLGSEQRQRQSLQAVNVGLVTNILLAVLKTTVGIIGHSPALLADGINSTSDVAYYIVVAIFVRRAQKPADYEHPYGHQQLESISALVVGSFVIAVGAAIFWNSLDSVYDLWSGNSDFSGATLLAMGVALFTVALKIILTLYSRRIGQETQNAAVAALAYDHRNDLMAAFAAAVGIFLGRQGYLWVDPLAGAIVAIFVLGTGIQIIRESTYDLMDTVPGKTLSTRITSLLQPIQEVEQIEEIHAHRFGPYLVVNVTIGVDGDMTVAEGDAIASQVEETLYHNLELLSRVYVHYHPARDRAAAIDGPSLIVESYQERSLSTDD